MPVNLDLTVKPTTPIDPASDPLTRMIQLRSLMSQDRLRQAQIAEANTRNQDMQAQVTQRNRALQDQNTFKDSFMKNSQNTSVPADQLWDKTFKDAASRGVDPDYLATLQKNHQLAVNEKATGDKEQLANDKEKYSLVDSSLYGLKQLDPSQIHAAYNDWLNTMRADPKYGESVNKGLQMGVIPQNINTAKDLDGFHAFVVGEKGMIEQAEKAQQIEASKQQVEASKASQIHTEQETANALAANPGIKAESEQKVAHVPVAKMLDTYTLSHGGLNPEQVNQQKNAEKQQQTAAGHLWIAQQDLALKKAKQDLELGPGAVKTWVDAMKTAPDSIKEVPAALRTAVSKEFQSQTGLPLPAAASGNSQTMETKARMALDNAQWIDKAVSNPEIQKRLGPILGRLGTYEQNLGKATMGLSPQAAQLAQELRTRMRYFVFQEGQAVLGGRLPQKLMEQLQASSADVHMDEPTLRGALRGAQGAATSTLDNVDKERFGGKARPRVMRGLPPGQTGRLPDGRKVASDDGGKTLYNPDTGERIQ